MSDKEEIFNIASKPSGEGAPVAELFNATTLVAALRGIIGFAFQDSQGRAILPQLTTDGKLPVSGDSSGIHVDAHDTIITPTVGLKTLVTTATLAVDKLYSLKLASGASTQTVLWSIEQLDGESETPRHKFITGSGEYTKDENSGCLIFLAGASGPQEVSLYGTQIKGASSDMHGTLCLLQIGA